MVISVDAVGLSYFDVFLCLLRSTQTGVRRMINTKWKL